MVRTKENKGCTPSPRLCASSVVFDDELVVFGGDAGQNQDIYINNVKNDFWRFNLIEGKWTKSHASHAGVPHVTEHSAVLYKDSMYYFGGCKDHGYIDALARFDLRTGEVEHLYTSLDRPAPRSAHSAVMHKDHMYIFGGWNGQYTFGDFCKYSFEQNRWRQVKFTGAPPSKRRAHSAVVLKDNMYIFGGYDGVSAPSDFNMLHKYNFDSEEWTIVPLTGDIPCGRSRCTLTGYDKKLYLIGGWDRQVHFNDMYEINTETYKSTRIKNNLSYYFEGIGQHSCAVYKDSIMVFGGFLTGKGKNVCTNDVFAVKLV